MNRSILSKVVLTLISILYLSIGNTIEASHIPGANITYTCNPANPLEYTFTFTMFYRCPGSHPATTSASYFTLTNDCGLTNPIVPTFNQVGTEIDVNQLCATATSNCTGGTNPGVWMYTYEAVIVLPADCDGWHLAFDLCCRDASTNLTNGMNNNMACSTTLNTSTSPCNNSPVVTSAPIPYACTNSPFSYCLTTSDAEGDSTYFTMVAPAGALQTPIAHLAGFTPTAPLTGFVLDPLTGCFSFTEPNAGNYVVAIQIEEFDAAGNLISTIIHDFQIQVVSCTNSPPSNPIIGISNVTGTGTQTGPNGMAACLGESFCFDVTFEDLIDPTDNLTIVTDGTTLFPGATFTQTGSNPVTGTFCWTVVPGNTGTVATFIVQDDGCPVMGTSGFGVTIDVIQGVYAGPDVNICGGSGPVPLGATGGTIFSWSPATGLSCTNCQNPIANPATTTTYTVTSNMGGACTNTDQVTVNVEAVPPTASITGNVGICGAGSNTLTASGGNFYLWSTGETTPSIVVSPGTTTDYHVTVTNFVNGCEAYETATVTVVTTPDPNLSDITICNGNSTTLTAEDGGTYLWSTGATTPDITVSPTTTTTYTVTVTVGTCQVPDAAVVTVTPTSAPVITCIGDTTVPQCAATVTFDTPIALDYCAASPCISSPLTDVLTAFTATGTTIAGNIPNGFSFTDGVTGTSISDGGSDMYDGGNSLNTNLATLIPYTGGAMSTHAGFGGGSYFTHKFNNLFVMAADLVGVNMFEITGNNGADGSGTYNGFTYTVTIGCMDYDVFVKRVNGAGDPSINHVYIIPSGSAATHSFATTTDNDLHTLTGLAGVTRLYYMLFSGTGGYAYTNAEIQAAVLDFLTQANTTGGGVAQAPVVQTTGLPSGSIFPIGTNTITFEATGVSGTSTCSFDIIVVPSTGPVITCPNDTTVSECANVVDFVTPTAIDFCGGCGTADIGDVLTDFSTNGATIAGNIPSGFSFSDGVTGTNISDGGSDMYDGGNQLNTNLGTAIPYTGGTMSTHAAFGGGSYFTHKFNNLFVMVADLVGVTTFEITGNNGADGSGTATGFTYTVSVGCKDYDVYVKRVSGAPDPSINHVYIIESGSGATHSFPTSTDNDLHTLTGLASVTRLYYMLFAGTGGLAYTNAQVQAAVLDFLTQVNASSGSSVAVAQIAGLPSGSAFPAGTNTVTFRATDAGGQTADCSFDIIVTPGLGPVIACRVDTTVSECNSVVTFSDPVSSDPCNPGCTVSPIASILTDFTTNGAAIAGNIPSGFSFTDGVTGTNISDGGSDMYDGGNQLNTNLATAIPYTGGAMSTHAAFGGGSYFTHKFNNLFVMVADLVGVTTFEITGNNGADGSGTQVMNTASITVGCKTYDVFVKRIHSAGDPSINHVYIIETGSGASHTAGTTTNDDLHTLTGLGSVTRLYYMLFAGTGGFNYTNAQIQAAIIDFLTQINASTGLGGGGVTIAQIAGLPSGSTFPVGTNTVTFRSTSTTSGLTADCSFDIIVQASPVASISGANVLCSGGSTTLTGAGGGTYLWNTGATTPGITVSPVVNTPYYVTVTDNLGCTDSASINTTIGTASTAPTITPMPGTYCPNTTMTLNATGGTAGTGSSIEWYSGATGTGTWLGTGNSINIAPTTNGTTYYIRREGTCNITGDAQVTINLKDYIYALNGASTNTYCTDNAGWHHFFNGNEILLSLRGDLSSMPAGSPTITVMDNGTFFQQTQGPSTAPLCASTNLTPGEERFEMERNWNVNIGAGTLSGAYDVRFYYQPAERTAIETAAANWMAAYPACGYTYKYPNPLGFYWFKNTGSDYTAPDYDGLHLGSAAGTTPNGVNYGELAGITSFSGGSGAIILVPSILLPVQWLYFDGETIDNKINSLRWATESESNSDHFNIQRSKDGVSFENIGSHVAQGNTTVTTHYTFDDENPFEGPNYYRLELVNTDGSITHSSTILLVIASDGLGYNFYPNPTNDVVFYQYEAKQKQNLRIEVLDVLGKQIISKDVISVLGTNNIPVDLTAFPAGTYMVRVHNQQSSAVHTVKVIKNKF